MKRKTYLWTILAKNVLIALLILTVVPVLSGCGTKKEPIDLIDYFTITYEGDNEATYARARFDHEAFGKKVMQALGWKDADSRDRIMELSRFQESVDYKLAPYMLLSNGDEITLTITFDKTVAESHGLIINDGVYTFEVEGRKVLPELPFDENTVKALIADTTVSYHMSSIPIAPERVHNIQVGPVEVDAQIKKADASYTLDLDCGIVILTLQGEATYKHQEDVWNCTYHHNYAQVKEWTVTGTYTGTEWGIAGPGIPCNAKYVIEKTDDNGYFAHITWSAGEECPEMETVSVTVPLIEYFDNARLILSQDPAVVEALGFSPYYMRAMRFDFVNGGIESKGELSLKKISD